MKFQDLYEKENKEHSAVSSGVQTLPVNQYMGAYKFSKDVAGHDGKKQHSPDASGSKAYTDKPIVVGYTDVEDRMTKAVLPKTKQTVGAGSEEPSTVQKNSPLSKRSVKEAYQNDEANVFYKYDTADGRLKQRMVQNLDEPRARSAGYKETQEQALKAAGIMRSKFDPKKFVQNQNGKWVTVYPYGQQGVAEASTNDYFKRRKDEEDRIAGTKAPAKRTPKQTDYEKKRKEQGVAEGAPELLKKEMPLHRHAEKLLAQNGVSKDDPDYHHHLNNTIKHLRQFGNIDLINKSDEQGMAEARRNPEQNMRNGSGKYDLINYAEDINDKDNWAVSMTMEPKLGINPQAAVSEDTPKGIYFYPLQYFMQMANRRESLTWGDNMPYIQLFQYDRSGEMTQQTKVDPAKLKQALSQYCSDEIIQQAIDEPEYDGTPYWFIYDCLSRLGKGDETNVIRWNKVLRDLGFTSVYDPGHGWIAYNEPTQGVVLDPRIIKQHKMFSNRNPKLEHKRYDLEGLANSIGWSSYYNSESQRERVPFGHPDKKKVMLDVAKSMLKQFLGKNNKEAKEMGYDKALKAAADKVIEILKHYMKQGVAEGFQPTVKGAKNMVWTPESLDEAFDQPYPMTWEKSEADDSMDALARLPDGSNLSIMFNMEYDEEGEEVIQVEFHRNNSQEVTGDGDAQRVFATVLAAIQQYIKTHNPKRLTFSASKEVEPDQNSESRAKLYDRLVMRYARTWGYRPLRADTGTIVRYELSRLKQGVAEEGYGTHPSQRVDPRTGKRYVPPKSPLVQAVDEGLSADIRDYFANPKNDTASPFRKKAMPPEDIQLIMLNMKQRQPVSKADQYRVADWLRRNQRTRTVYADVNESDMGEGVIYQLDKENPMSGTEVLVIGGAGRYSLDGLRAKARKEVAELAKDLEIEHGGAFRRSAHNVKQLQNTLNTIVAAYDELNQIRKLGGIRSKGIKDEDAIVVREGLEVMEKWTQKYKNSINCSDPKGFSQRAHCAGKKK